MTPFQWDEIQVFTFFHVLVRSCSFFVFLPILGEKTIPSVVRILFGLSFACVLHPVLWAQGMRLDPATYSSPVTLTGSILGEATFGLLVGFIARWVFDAIQFAGSMIGTTMGFSMSSVVDPHTETQTMAIAELHYVMAALLFLAIDGHHLYLQAALESFRILPFAGSKILVMNENMGKYLIEMTAGVLQLGVRLAAPIIVVIFFVNATFGMLARAVPQLNFLVVSFAANIIVGLIVVIVSMPGFMTVVDDAFAVWTPQIIKFMKLFGT